METATTYEPACAPELFGTYEEGAILTASWGYDQTNVDCFRVVKRKTTPTGQIWLTLQPISQRTVEATGYDSARVVPGTEDLSKPTIRRLLHVDGRGESGCRFEPSFGWMRSWDGKPLHSSWGH